MRIRNVLLGVAAVIVLLVCLPAAAWAQTGPDWNATAACESHGNWSANTGNGFSGGLQFAPQTWAANKPAGAPANAADATPSQQMQAADSVLATQGPGAWPHCFQGGGTAQPAAAPKPAPARPPARPPAPVVGQPRTTG